MSYSRVVPSNLTGPSDFTKFLDHPVKIYHTLVTAATASAVLNPDIVGMYRATISGTPMGSKVANLSYFHATLRIKVVIQGQPFAAGQTVLAFRPNINMPGLTKVSTPEPLNMVNVKIVPHLILDPSKTQTYEIDLPVCTPNGYYAMKTAAYNPGSYAMEMFAFNPLISGTAVAPSMSVCIYMSLVNPVFEGLTLLSGEFVKEKQEGGTLSATVTSISKIAGNIAPYLPFIGPSVQLFSQVSGLLGSGLALLGFSKPPIVETQLFPLTRVCDNYSQFDGKSTAIVLAGSQTNSVGISPAYGGGDPNDIVLASLCKKKGIIYQSVFLPSQSSGAAYALSVHPTKVMLNGVGDRLWLTPLAGVAAPFTQWTGDLTYTIEFIASVFHRATVLIAWDPVFNATAPPLDDAIETLQNVTVSISGNTSVEIMIPWKQPVPWLQVLKPTDSALTSTNKTTNGTLYFYLVNPITSNGSTDGIYFNVYIHSDNIKFAAPSQSRCDFPWKETLLSGEFCPIDKVSFGTMTDLSKATFKSYGEDYLSVKHLTSKLGLAKSGSADIDPAGISTFIGMRTDNSPVMKVDNTPNTFRNFFGWFAPAYLGYRGGIRYSFHAYTALGHDMKKHYWVSHSPTSTPSAVVVGNTGFTSSSVPPTVQKLYAYSNGNRDIAPCMDFVAPMMIPFDFFDTQGRYSTKYDEVVPYAAVGMPTVTTQVDCTLSNATADEGNFVWFLGFPTMVPW